MAGKTEAQYSQDWLLKYGVERAIEIISEATRRIPTDVKSWQPQIPWQRVTAIGNILRHEYDRIVDQVVFEVVEKDLAPLKSAILALEASLDEPEE